MHPEGNRVTTTSTDSEPTATPTATTTDQQAVGRTLAVVLGLLTIFGPISMDLYLPAVTMELESATVGIVIAQAAGRDLYSGPRLVRYYGRLTVLGGLAAIVGPVIGGQLAAITDWQGLFLFLAAVGVAILFATIVVLRETLPREHRVAGELRHPAHDFRRLFTDRMFLGTVLVSGFANAALFAYLSGATYVLQGIYHLSPQEYSFAFGLNSLGSMIFGYLGPLVGLGGADTAVPLGVVTVAAAVLAVTAYVTAIRRATTSTAGRTRFSPPGSAGRRSPG
jgi:MFS transporter, DHA1 family, multidrug resistance protein